jgi:hypothetical protein
MALCAIGVKQTLAHFPCFATGSHLFDGLSHELVEDRIIFGFGLFHLLGMLSK